MHKKINDSYNDFVYKKFKKKSWECEVKSFIENLTLMPNRIWYKSHRTLQKKIHQELIPFGFYVKYDTTIGEGAIFYLNKNDDEADGFLCGSEKKEAVQIVSAFYGEDEALGDRLLMDGSYIEEAVWENDRFAQLQERIKERLHKKQKKHYVPIDTLLVALKNHFIWNAKREYPDIAKMLEALARNTLNQSQFRKIVFVDSDMVGSGDIYVFP